MRLKDRPIGEVLEKDERDTIYELIIGGVSWPAKRPGYAVLVGVAKENYKPYRVYILDEYQSHDLVKLIRQCHALTHKWTPHSWRGDCDNDAAEAITGEVSREFRSNEDPGRCFSCSKPTILGMERPYEYMLPHLNNLLQEDRKRLILKDALVTQDLHSIDPEDLPELQIGDYPAIEAVCYAEEDIFQINEALKKPCKSARQPPGPMCF